MIPLNKNISDVCMLAQALIACPSITPEDAGAQAIITHRLETLGFQIQHLPFGSVENLWAVRGTPCPSVVFAGHTDVVPPGPLEQWQSPPFQPIIQDGFLFGRGAADMKGGLAAMLVAAERFIQEHPQHAGSIAFLITSDEEGTATHGTVKVIEHLQKTHFPFNYCIVGEPTSRFSLGDTIKSGCRGSLNVFLKIKGKQGHIAYPHNQNPIHLILKPLATLADIPWDQDGDSPFSIDCIQTSFQCSNIHAGTGVTNVIPGELDLACNWRFTSKTTPESLLMRLEDVLQSHQLCCTLKWELSGEPFVTSGKILIEAAKKAIYEVVHTHPILSTGGGISDARFIAKTGAEVIELGVSTSHIHAINECVAIRDLDNLALIYQRILELLLIPKK